MNLQPQPRRLVLPSLPIQAVPRTRVYTRVHTTWLKFSTRVLSSTQLYSRIRLLNLNLPYSTMVEYSSRSILNLVDAKFSIVMRLPSAGTVRSEFIVTVYLRKYERLKQIINLERCKRPRLKYYHGRDRSRLADRQLAKINK